MRTGGTAACSDEEDMLRAAESEIDHSTGSRHRAAALPCSR
jgi:hypothetical protein